MSRILQVNSMLQKALAEIISQNLEVPFDFFLTITRLDCGSDLKTAKVFVSVLPFSKAEEGIKFLVNNRHETQGLLGKKIKLKFTPRLNFVLDDTEQTASEIYQTLDDLNN